MPTTEWALEGTFSKRDDERHLVFGWAYTAQIGEEIVVDHSGDFVDKASLPALEEAAYEYLLKSREADEMHIRFENVAQIVESVFLTVEKMDAMGIKGDRIGWWVGFKVADPEVWQKIKSGKYAAFSIRGSGTREASDA